MARPRLKQVAELAQVSQPTVSRVLNGRTGVAPATRDRVVKVLRDLGFTEIPAPRSARRGVVGVVCGEFLNPVFPTLVHHLSTELGQSGFLSTVTVTDRLNPESRCITELVETAVDGIVFVGGAHAEIDGDLDGYRDLVDAGVPIVLVNGTDTPIDVPHIRCDEGAGARKALLHLHQLGHRRLGCVLGNPRFVPTQRLAEAYHTMVDELGVSPVADPIVRTAFTLEGAQAGARRLLRRGVTGIVAANDLMALGAIAAAAGLGLSVPGDVSVVGYDGTDITSFTNPPLTTLRQPFEDMAHLIAQAIQAEINDSTAYRDRYVFEPELVVRASSGPILVHPDERSA